MSAAIVIIKHGYEANMVLFFSLSVASNVTLWCCTFEHFVNTFFNIKCPLQQTDCPTKVYIPQIFTFNKNTELN